MLMYSVRKHKKHRIGKDNSLITSDETTRLTTMTEEEEENCGISIKVKYQTDSES